MIKNLLFRCVNSQFNGNFLIEKLGFLIKHSEITYFFSQHWFNGWQWNYISSQSLSSIFIANYIFIARSISNSNMECTGLTNLCNNFPSSISDTSCGKGTRTFLDSSISRACFNNNNQKEKRDSVQEMCNLKRELYIFN